MGLRAAGKCFPRADIQDIHVFTWMNFKEVSVNCALKIEESQFQGKKIKQIKNWKI